MSEDRLEVETEERLARRPWPAEPLARNIEVSFEVFPPATEAGYGTVVETVGKLAAMGPAFVSVTYGAGGSTRHRTVDVIRVLRREFPELPIAGHLTCGGASMRELNEVLDHYAELGVRRVVALRGDPTEGHATSTNEVPDARALVELIRGRPDGAEWHVSVAGYPETHPLAASRQADLSYLADKVSAGADRVISQFFFDNEDFLRFHRDARAAGVGVPIVPGIMPVADLTKISRFAQRCGASIPAWMPDLYEGLDGDPDVRRLVGATLAAEQCRHLAEHGINVLHLYTMNHAAISTAVCRMLGMRPRHTKSHPTAQPA